MAHNLVTSLENQATVVFVRLFGAYLTAIWFLWRFLNNSYSLTVVLYPVNDVLSPIVAVLCSSLQCFIVNNLPILAGKTFSIFHFSWRM